MTFRRIFTGLCLATSLWTSGALAAPGDPDSTFGQSGVATLGWGNGLDVLGRVRRQADGRFVILGQDSAGWFLARTNADGTLDASFGTSGRRALAFESASPPSLAVDSIGRILVSQIFVDSTF